MPRLNRKLPKYKGPLNKAIEGHRMPLTIPPDQMDNWIAEECMRLARERTKKLELLCDHYEITFKEPGLRYAALALHLATDHVRGFDIAPDSIVVDPKDRNKKRTARWKKSFEMVVSIIQKMHKDNGIEMSDIDACAYYAERFEDHELQKPGNHDAKMKLARTLQNLLIDARKVRH